jgi:2-oxoglutarate ferredoxin oxidoreductase subunit delta
MLCRVEFREDRCKGCLLCVHACPSGIIHQSTRFNQQGYKVAEIPAERMPECKGCAFCALMCPDSAIRVFKSTEAA